MFSVMYVCLPGGWDGAQQYNPVLARGWGHRGSGRDGIPLLEGGRGRGGEVGYPVLVGERKGRRGSTPSGQTNFVSVW